MEGTKLTVTCAICKATVPVLGETWTEGPPIAVAFTVDPCKSCTIKAAQDAERKARDKVYREMSSC